MQFTPQQLSGGPKFSSKVKIGNWSEDRARVEVRRAVMCSRFDLQRKCCRWDLLPL